jgi:hypothetical protein
MLRAAAVGGGAYLAGKQRARRQAEQESQDSGQDQRISDLEQQQGDAAPPAAGTQAAAPSMTDQLNQLADLHKRGVLSDSEFAAAKSKLLGA